MKNRTWGLITAEAYEAEVAAACADIERLRAAIWARYAARGNSPEAALLAAELRDLRAAIAALLAGGPEPLGG